MVRFLIKLAVPVASLIISSALLFLIDAQLQLNLLEIILLFAACFCTLLALKIHFSQEHQYQKMRSELKGMSSYEAGIRDRLEELRARLDDTSHIKSLEQRLDRCELRLDQQFDFTNSKPKPELDDEAGDEQWLAGEGETASNVVSINRAVETLSSNGKIRIPKDLGKCLDDGKLTMHLQPMLSLLDRSVVGYEALARLELGPNKIVPASQFIKRAEKTGCIKEIDHRMLFKIIKLIREFDREDISPRFHWNISDHSLSGDKVFSAFENMLKSNSAICAQITAEIKQDLYASLDVHGLRKLSLLREMGLSVAIDNCVDLELAKKAMQSGLFSDVKIPTKRLVGYHEDDMELAGAEMAEHAIDTRVRIIATEVEKEFQVMELIDQDILHGQGNLFMEPKPARSNPAAAKLANIR